MAESSMFADHIARNVDSFEPQREHQAILEIDIGDDETKRLIELALSKAFLPTLTSDEIPVHYLNEIVYVAGKYVPDTGTVSIIDYIDEDAQKKIYDWRKQVHDPDTGFVGAAVLYKKRANIILLSPDGQKSRAWELQGVWPKSVNFGSIDMASTDTVKVEMTLRYDKAKYVGRT